MDRLQATASYVRRLLRLVKWPSEPSPATSSDVWEVTGGQGVAGSNPAVPTQVRRLIPDPGSAFCRLGTKIEAHGSVLASLTAGQVCHHADDAGSSASPWLTGLELGRHGVQDRGLASTGPEARAAIDQYQPASWCGSRAVSVASDTFVP